MKALPFPCIRPAQDRVLEALPAMGSILSGNDALRGAIADGLMLKDPGAAYYVYECSGEPGRVTGVVAICPDECTCGRQGRCQRRRGRRCARDRRTQSSAAPRVARLRGVARHGHHPGRCQRGRLALRRHRPRGHYAPRVGGQARGRRRRHPCHARPGAGAGTGRRPCLRCRTSRGITAPGRRCPCCRTYTAKSRSTLL